jgi:putative methanogenesis marker protein 12
VGEEMKFLGIDHGSLGIRFSSLDGEVLEIDRKEASLLGKNQILEMIGKICRLEEIKLVGMNYGMGDAISKIVDAKNVESRGIRGPSGPSIGGGKNVFDAVSSSLPCILLPGIHSGNCEPPFDFFSHSASGEKLALAYLVYRKGYRNFIISDVSATTVTIGCRDGRILGGIDACIFSPGMYQGPLDLDAIRMVDEGKISAGDAFFHGGIRKKFERESGRFHDTLSAFVSMEIGAMKVLIRDAEIFLAGSAAELIKEIVEENLREDVHILDRFASARGCALVAKDVFYGAKEILGIGVDYD